MELAEGLAVRGHRVHLFARTAPFGRARFGAGVTFHGLEEGRRISHRLDAEWCGADVTALATRVVSVAAADGLDVLHVHYAIPFARVAAEVRRLGGHSPRLVATLHGTDVSVHGKHPRTGPALARALQGVDALTTVSRSHARLSVETLKLSFQPVVIPNFVNVQRFRPKDRGGANGHRPVVIHVSNFRKVKNPEAVARVFVRVRRSIDAELWLVGDGEMMAAIRDRLVGAGLEGDVRHFGLHDHVEEILPHANVLLLTSTAESFCLAALEAAACGVPVVAPRVGGVPEVVADGKTGDLFEPGDEEAAAGLVVRLLRDPLRRSAMAEAAVRRSRRFGGEIVVPRYEALYRRVLAQRLADPAFGRPEG